MNNNVYSGCGAKAIHFAAQLEQFASICMIIIMLVLVFYILLWMRTFILFFCARSVSDHKAISLYILGHSLFAVFWRCQFTRRRSHDYFLENNPLILFEPVTHTHKNGGGEGKKRGMCVFGPDRHNNRRGGQGTMANKGTVHSTKD